MPSLKLPILGKTLWLTGDVLLRAELTLLLRTNQQTWESAFFRVDPGTEMTTMPASDAKKLDLPMPQNPVPGLVMNLPGGQGTGEVRAGIIRAQVPGLDNTEHIFPCYFVGDPNQVPPTTPKNLLGLSGVVDKIRITFDGTAVPGCPYGQMLLEKI
jgi:hypothetical protein